MLCRNPETHCDYLLHTKHIKAQTRPPTPCTNLCDRHRDKTKEPEHSHVQIYLALGHFCGRVENTHTHARARADREREKKNRTHSTTLAHISILIRAFGIRLTTATSRTTLIYENLKALHVERYGYDLLTVNVCMYVCPLSVDICKR
ncbi:hypothetical protein EYC84_005553 [Monilinia fructicola]|uniref:Uncharacterized protein n=1 Tax=Monilinia fructicola TaxID=38448 RepID=A0A5M9JZC8_MONFR|nr:hypothetical protein EYC84_005553 [Monilinia fructicola]